MRVERLIRERLLNRFGNPEVDDLGNGLVVVVRDQDVRRFDVPMDDAFLMSVLDSLTHLGK